MEIKESEIYTFEQFARLIKTTRQRVYSVFKSGKKCTVIEGRKITFIEANGINLIHHK